jgi:hypothetical protein
MCPTPRWHIGAATGAVRGAAPLGAAGEPLLDLLLYVAPA